MRDFIIRSHPRITSRDEEGQGMLEYALIISFVALVVFAALTIFGTRIANVYNSVANSVNV